MTSSLALVAGLALFNALPVVADGSANPGVPPQPATQAAELEEVSITGEREQGYAPKAATTGTKTDTPVMETPLSIQVVPQQVLQDQNATTLEQALKNVSGVRATTNAGLQEALYLRGFLTATTFRNGFRVDDALGEGVRSLTNVESVEVLKGPAAILYGRVEPGGVVNIVTRQPQATPYYSAEQQAGSWDHYLTNLDATGPITEGKSLLYRANLSYEKANSWRDDVSNERLFIAPSLLWKPGAGTQVMLDVEYDHHLFTYDAAQNLPFDTTTSQYVWLPRNQNLAAGEPVLADTSHVGLTFSQQLGEAWSGKLQLVRHEAKSSYDPFYYVAGFTQVDPTSWTVDRVRSAGDGGDTTWASILDLTGHLDTAGIKHTLLLGADFYRQEVHLHAGYSTGLPSTTDAFNPAPPSGLIIDPATLMTYDSTTDNLGVYVQDQVALPHRVHVLAGLRYQKVTRKGSITDATGTTTPDPDQADHAVTPRVGVLWQAAAWLNPYGNYAQNFGANTGRDWQGKPLPPESAQQWEVGAKSELFGGAL
jgi:iron complex outermembrane receptor protein